MNKEKIVTWILRIGIALTFLYPAVASFLYPVDWVGYFPIWLRNIIPEQILLFGFFLFELFLAIWVLSSWKTFYASILSALTILAIMLLNIGLFDIVFRDVPIFFAAIALAILSYNQR